MSNNATKRGARGLASVDWDDVHPDTKFYLKWLEHLRDANINFDFVHTSLISRWQRWEEAGQDAYFAAMQPFEFRPGQKCAFLDAITENRCALLDVITLFESMIYSGAYANFCRKFGMHAVSTRKHSNQVGILDQAITWIDLMRQGAKPSELLAGWEARKKLMGDNRDVWDRHNPDYSRSSPGPGIITGGIL